MIADLGFDRDRDDGDRQGSAAAAGSRDEQDRRQQHAPARLHAVPDQAQQLHPLRRRRQRGRGHPQQASRGEAGQLPWKRHDPRPQHGLLQGRPAQSQYVSFW